ncbi:amidohydrolase family protein [Nocardia sp. CA-119907]|uniref:amidohydrolase family protein n=1 Tax=Nocardia sp. CA-119907 TaxID=3239973 RepID=UPI003D987194
MAVAPLALAAACTGSDDSAPAATRVRAFTGARLIDGRGGPAIENATVVVSGDRIVSAGAGGPTPTGAEVVNLGGTTILPGLIDAHVHLGGLKSGSSAAFGGRGLTDDYAEPRTRSLDYGVTSVRSLGDFLDDSLAVRDEIARGALPGPRIVTSGPSFQIKGGHPNGTVWANDSTAAAQAARMPTTTDEATRMVDDIAGKGVDVIKVIMSSIVMPGGKGNGQKLPWDTVAALVAAAHRNKLKVSAHIENPDDATRAIDLGVDQIEHMYISRSGPPADESSYDSAFALMADKGTIVTPTMIVNVGTTEPLAQVDLRTLTVGHTLVKRAYDHGVRLGVGSDAHEPDRHGWGLLAELVMLVNDQQVPALRAIEAATKTNSEVLGLSDRLGTVEAGKLADLLVVSGNPAERITDLANVRLVIQGGKTVVDKMR